jgi:hypothetical protein
MLHDKNQGLVIVIEKEFFSRHHIAKAATATQSC